MGFLKKMISIVETTLQSGPAPLAANKNRVICQRFAVKGGNPSTGRQKTVTVVAASDTPESVIGERSGLVPPYVVTVKPPEPPTEAQVQYAEKLRFAFPTDATKEDASVFLSRAENEKPLKQPAAPEWMVRYVADKGIYVPAYAGADEVSWVYLSQCSKRELAAFFCMRVYCSAHKKKYRVLENAKPAEIELFYSFADAYSKDTEFMRSLNHYDANELPLDRCVTPKRLKAFDIASVFLKVKGAK